MRSSIVVAGSSNTDMVVKTDRLPSPGETIIGGTFFMNPGGKGANQAVAAARLGGNVSFIAKTGNDVFGQQAIQNFKKEGINTSYVLCDENHSSGVALINVDKNGENCIAVASGANAALMPEDLIKARQAIKEAAIILVQLEIPLCTVDYIASLASQSGVKVLLNPAPVCSLPQSLFQHVSIITPNKKEAEMLTGIQITDLETAQQASEKIHSWGVKTVIITMGSKGAVILSEGRFVPVPSFEVEPVDTTAAGDIFNGALAVALSEGLDIKEATEFACKAAAISVTRLGAQQSAPFRSEVKTFLNKANATV